jgi:hypothetical protein
MKIFVLLPLLIVLGGCSKEPVEQKDQADQAASMESSIESLEKSIVGKILEWLTKLRIIRCWF